MTTMLRRAPGTQAVRTLLPALCLATLLGQAPAATRTWDAGVNNTWDTATTANWTGSTWVSGDVAVFGAAGAGAVSVTGGGVTAASITFNTPGYTLAGGAITINGPTDPRINVVESATINSAITLSPAQTWSVAPGKTLTLGGNVNASAANTDYGLSGAGNYVFNGSIGGNVRNVLFNSTSATTATFAGVNTFSGQLFLGNVAGPHTLNFSAVNQLGSGTGGNYIALQNGATLRYTGTGSETTAARDLYWNSGAATIDIPSATANLTFNISGGTRNNSFAKSGAGQLTLLKSTAINESTGSLLALNGGTLEFNQNHAGAISRFTGVVTGAAGTQIRITGTGYIGNDNLSANWSGNLASLDIGGSASCDLRGQGITVDALTGAGAVANSYASGVNTLTVGAGNGSGVFSGVIKQTAPTGYVTSGSPVTALTKAGAGTQTLAGASTYTGTTTVNAGTLLLETSTGSLGSSSPLALGGGNFSVKGKPGAFTSAQTLGNLTLTANTSSRITIDPNGGTSTTLTLGNTWTPGTGTVLFDLSAGSPTTAIVASSPALDASGIIGAWATVKDDTGTGLATVSAGQIVRYTGGTVLTPTSDSATTNFTTTPTDGDYAGGALTMAVGSHALNTLAIGTGAGGTLELSAQTLTMTANGSVLVDGGGDYTIQNGTISGAGVSLAKHGTGKLTLSGVNTYTGVTAVNGGNLTLAGGSAIADAGAVALANVAGASLTLNGSETIGSLAGGGELGGNVNLNGYTLTAGGNNSVTTYGGVLGGLGGSLTKTGTGTLTLSGAAANTYTGLTTLNGNHFLVLSKSAGVVAVPGDIEMAGSTPTLYLTANGQLGGNGTLNFTASGNARFDLYGTSQTLAGINDATGRGVVQNSEAVDGAPTTTAPATLTLNGSGAYSFYGYLRNSTGPLTVNKNGAGTQTLNRNGDRFRIGSAGDDIAAFNMNAGKIIVPNTYIVFGEVGGAPSSLVINGGIFSHTGTGGLYLPNGTGAPATMTVNAGGTYTDAGPFYSQANTGTINNNGGTITFAGGAVLANVGTFYWNQTGGSSTFGGESSIARGANPGTMTISGGTVTQTGQNWFNVGFGTGQATLTITDNGNFVTTKFLIGRDNATSKGTVNMTGGTFTASGANDRFYFGHAGRAIWNQSGGVATFSDNEIWCPWAGQPADINLSGGSFSMTSGRWVNLGHSNQTGTLTVSGTGYFRAQYFLLGRDDATSTGVVNLYGGTMNIGGTVDTGNPIYLGHVGTAIWNQTGGTATIAQQVNVAHSGKPGTISVSGGSFLQSLGVFYLGVGAGTATLNVSGTALVGLNHLRVANSAGVAGVVNLNGGTLRIDTGGVTVGGTPGTGTGTLNFNGGTFQAGGSMSVVDSPALTTVINSGGVVLDTQSYTLTFNKALTLGTGSGGLTKLGAGTLALCGANTFTGSTTVQLGTLVLDYASTLQDNSKLSDTTALNLADATLRLAGGAHEEAVGGAVIGGAAFVERTGGTATLYLKTITRSGAGTLDVQAGVVKCDNAVDGGGLLPAWITVRGQLATKDGSGYIVAAGSGYTDVDRLGGTIPDSATAHIRVIEAGAGGNITVAGVVKNTVSTLLQGATGGAATIDLSGSKILRFGAEGSLAQAADVTGALTIQNGTLTAGGADNAAGTLTINNPSTAQAIALSTVIADNGSGAVALAKTGAGAVVLTGGGTYTGGLRLNAGTLRLNHATALGTGTLTINGGSLDSAIANLVNAGNNAQVWNADLTFAGTQNLDLGAGPVSLGTADGLSRTLTVAANTLTIGGSIGNGTTASSLIKNGAGNLALTGSAANTFSGALRVNQGAVYFSKAAGAALGGDLVLDNNLSPDVYTTVNNQFPPGAVVRFVNNAGDHGRFDLMGTVQTVAGIDNNSYWAEKGVVQNSEAVANTGTSTLVLNGTGSYTFWGYLRNWTGRLGLTKTGTGTQVLAGGNINYTGPTTVNAGTLSLYNCTGFNTAATVNPGGALENDYRSGNGGWGAGTVITLNGGALAHRGSGYLTLAGGVILAADSTISVVNSGANNQLFLDNGLYGVNRILTINNSGSAATGVHIRNATAANFSGAVQVNGGELAIGTSANQVLASADLTLSAATLHLGSSAFAMTGTGATLKSLNGDLLSTVTSAGSATTLTVGTLNGSGAFYGSLVDGTSGTLALAKIGTGTLALTGVSTFTGGTTVSAGLLKVNNGAGSGTGTGAVIVNGGTLAGTGTANGAVTVNSGGRVAPGDSSVSTLTLSSLTVNDGAILDFEFNTTPANDKIAVTTGGGLTVNGGGINLYQAGTTSPLTATGTYDLIAYSGTLNGAAGNLTVLNPVAGMRYSFSGSGNWLRVTLAAGAPTWSGAGGNDNWTTGANWGGVAPVAGDGLTFGATDAARLSNVNDFAGGTLFGGITFANTGSYTLGGADVNLRGNVINNAAGDQAIGLNLVLDGAGRSVGGSGGAITISGGVSDAGGGRRLTKTGANTVTLTGANTYTGGTTLDAGVLALGSSGAIGAAGSIAFSGGTLQFSAANATDYSARFNTGAGQAYRLDTAGQNVTLATALTSVGGTLAKLGAGTLALSGATSYSGPTTVNAGTLKLAATSAFNSSITLGGGGLLTDSTANSVMLPQVITGDASGGKVTIGANNYEYWTYMTADNSYTGGTLINAGGALILGNNSAAGSVLGDIVDNGRLGIYHSGVYTFTNNVTGAGSLYAYNNTMLARNTISLAGTLRVMGSTTLTIQTGASATLGDAWLAGFNTGTSYTTMTGGSLTITGAARDNRDAYFVFNQSGGEVNLGALYANQTESGNGGGTSGGSTYNLTGGKLTVGDLWGGNGTAWNRGITLNLGGGTLAASKSFTLNAYTVNLTGYNGNVTIDSGISTLGSAYAFGGAGGLTKIGAGTLAFSVQNTYTGGTTVNAGILNLTGGGGANGTIRGAVTVNSGAALNLNTADALGYNVGGASVTALNINGGTVTAAGGGNQTTVAAIVMTGATLNGSVNVDLFNNTASITTLASATPSAITVPTMNLRQNDTVFSVADGAAASDLTISAALGNGGAGNNNLIKTGAGTLTLTGNNVYSGTTAIGGGTLELAGAGALGGGSYAAAISANGALVVNSTAAQILSGALTGSGALTKRNTGALTLAGANGFAGATTVEAGTLTLDYGTQDNSKLADGAGLILAGGALNLTGGTHEEVVGSATLSAGASTVTRTSGAGVLNLGAITRLGNATLNFSADKIAKTTNANDASGLLGTWATVGGNYAMVDGEGFIVAYTGYASVTRLSSGSKVIADDAASNVRIIEGTGTAGYLSLGAATTTINSLNQSVSGGSSLATLDFAGRTLVVNSLLVENGSAGLLLGTGSNNGTLKSAGTQLILNNPSANGVTIHSVITDGAGASLLVKSGSGPLTLNGANTFTGGLSLDGGALSLGHASAVGTGTLTINAGGLNNSTAAALTLAANNVQIWNGDFTYTGPLDLNLGTGAVTLGANRQVTVSAGKLTVGGAIAGSSLSLTKAGAGTLTLGAANTYSGGTTILAGTLAEGPGGTLADAGALTVNGATAIFDLGTNHSDTVNAVLVDGGGTIVGTGSSALTGAAFDLRSGTLSVALAGVASLAKTTTGLVTLSGAMGNSYSGTTTLTQGQLALAKTGGTVAIPGDITGDNYLSPDIYATMDNQFAPGAVMRFVGTGGDHVRFELLGTAQTLAGIENASCNGRWGVIQHREQVGAAAVSGTSRLTLNGSGTYYYSGYLRDTGGTLSLTKSGTGTQKLAGDVIDYNGSTTVTGGRLILYNNDDTWTRGYNISAGATVEVYRDTSTVYEHRYNGFTLSGAGVFEKTGAGTMDLNENNDGSVSLSSGALIDVKAGTFRLGNGSRSNWGNNKADMNVAAGATFDVWDDNVGVYVDALTGSGTILKGLAYNAPGNGTLTVGVDNGSGVFAGVLQNGTGSPTAGILALTKVGTGTQTLTGANTYGGGTSVNGGILLVNNVTGSGTGTGTVTVNDGTLSGTGTISGLVAASSGGHVAPGASVGTLTAGSLALAAGSVLDIECNATPANDRLVVTTSGGLTINGGGVYLYQEGTTNPWSTPGFYNLIGYSGAIGGVGVGALSVLNPQPGLNYRFIVDAGWVVLAVSPAPVWSGAGADVNWQTGDNWGGMPPFALDTLTFGTLGAVRLSNNNDFAPGTQFGGITFANGGVYTLGGSPVNLLGSVVNNSSGNQTLNLGLTLDGAGRYFATAAGNLTVAGAIGETGGAWSLTKSGAYTLTLTGNNTYSGGTTLEGGTLALGSAAAIGSAGTIAFGGGTLQFSTANATDYSPRFSTAAGQAYRLDTAGQAVTAGTALTSVGGALTKLGAGTLTLNGANTFVGGLTVNGGTVKAGTTTAFGAGPVTVTSGGTADLYGKLMSSTAVPFTIAGAGAADQSGALVTTGGDSSIYNLTLSGNATVYNANNNFNQRINIYGTAINMDGRTLTVGGANAYNSVTDIRTSHALVGGGAINVASGMLLLEAPNQNWTGTYTVNSGAWLGTYTSGTLNGNLVLNGGTLFAAQGGANVTYSGNVTLSAPTLVGWNNPNGWGNGVIFMTGNFSGSAGLTANYNDLRITTATTIGTGPITINSGATLYFNQPSAFTLANPVGGAGNIVFNTTATMTVNATAAINMTGGIYVGYTANGRLNVESGAAVTAAFARIGDTANTMVMTINGGTVTLTGGTPLVVAAGNPSTGTLNINGGTLAITGGGTATLGDYGAAVWNQTGGTVNFNSGANDLWMANNGGSSTMTITGGSYTQSGGGAIRMGVRAGATLTVGGTAFVSSGGIIFGHGSTGGGVDTVNLNGGTLQVGYVTKQSGTPDFKFNGGTLLASASSTTFMQGLNAAYVLDGGAVIDTAANNITIAQNLLAGGTGLGALTKLGAGTLTLTGANTYTGGTALNNGTVSVNAISDGGASALGPSGGLSFNGGSLQYTGATAASTVRNATTWTMASIDVSNAAGTLTLGGIVGGNGGLVKAGAGTLELGGVNTYVGVTTINAGTLKLNAGGSLATTPTITVGSGATFDVASAGGFTLGAGRTLQGAGSVVGAFTAGARSQVLPGAAGTAATLSFATGLTQAAGATNVFDLVTAVTEGGGVNDLVTITGALEPNGATIVVNPLQPLTSGAVYRLMNYSGAKTTAFNPVVCCAQTGVRYTFTLIESTPNQINLRVDDASANLVWSGATPDWDLNTSPNWNNDTLTFYNGDAVIFNDSGVNTTVNLVGTLLPSAVTVNNTGKNYTFQGSGTVGGSARLTKQGTGTLTLTGNQAYSGATTVNAGSLVLSGVTNLASAVITNSAAVTADLGAGASLNYAGNMTGSGTLTKSGAGTLTLSGVNTYAGATAVNAGTLQVSGTPQTGAPPVSGYIVWLDAYDVNGNGVMPADGVRPGAWMNKATTGTIGNFPSITSGTTPATFFRSSQGFGNRPVLRFYGNNTTYSLFYNANNMPAPCTVMYVSRLTGEANYRLLGAWNGGTGSNWLLGYWGGRKDVGHYDNGWDTANTTSADTGTYLYEAVIPASGNASTYRNGTLVGSLLAGTGPNGLKIGGGYGGAGTEYSSGEIAEVLVYNWTLSDSERKRVEQYLIKKWGLGALPDGADVTVASGATLDLNGGSQNLGALNDSGGAGGTVLNSAARTAATLITGTGNKSATFNGVIANGAGAVSLNKGGTGTLTLGGSQPNTYTGLTTFAQGYLGLNKTVGPAIPGDFLGENARLGASVVYTTKDNQFTTNTVMRFMNTSDDHVRFELLGTVQNLAGIDNSLGNGRSVIQHREQTPGGITYVSSASTLILNGAGSYWYNGWLRSDGGTLSLIKRGSGTQTLYGGTIYYTGPTTVEAGTLTLFNTTGFQSSLIDNRATVRMYADGNNAAVVSTILSGAGTWTVDGPGGGTIWQNRVILRGNGSDATNAINVVNSGKLWVDQAGRNAIGDAQLVNLGASATFYVYQGIAETIGGLTGNGIVYGGDAAGMSALTVGGGNRSASFAGTIQNNLSTLTLTKIGTGTQTLAGASTYSGGTAINDGTLLVNNVAGSGTGTGAVSVNGGTLGGGGTLSGVVTVNAGGRVTPGGGGVGTLTAGGLTLVAGSILELEFNATPANDKLGVTTSGGLVVNGGGLYLYQAGSTSPWATPGTYNLISYSGAIGGAGLGALEVLNPQPGLSYRFTVSGGWVVLNIGTAAKWSGNGGDDNWLTGANWGGSAPVGGDTLTFGQAGALRLGNVNNFAANTPFGGLTFADGGSYTLSGSPLNLQGGIVNNNAEVQTLSLPLVLDGSSRSFVAASGDLVVNGNISEAGGAWSLNKGGGYTLTLGGANTYTGGTALGDGTLVLASAGALGSAGTIAFGGGTLQFSAANTTDYSGRFSTAAGQEYRLDTAGQNVTLATALTSAGGSLTKRGAGTLTVTGAGTYTGATTINAGTLKAGNVAQLPVNSAATIAAGAQFDFAGFGNTTTRAYSFTAAGAGPDGRGAIINTGGTIGANSSLRSLTLTGDTTIGGIGNYAVNDTARFDIGYGGGLINGGGYTLTVTGGSVVPLRGTTVNLANLIINNAFVYSEDVNNSLGTLVTVNPGGAVGGYNGRNNNANIVFNGGTLSTAGGGASCSYGGTLTANATFTISTASVCGGYGSQEIVVNGLITGPGGLIVSGGYWARLTAANDYAGGTTVNAGGNLLLGNNSAGGSVAGPIVVNGTLGIHHSDAYTFANTVTGSGAMTLYSPSGRGATVAGNVNLAGLLQIGETGTHILNGAVRVGSLYLDWSTSPGYVTQTGGSVTVDNAAGNVFRIAHYNQTGVYSITGGELVNLNGRISVGWDGPGTLNVSGGTVRTPQLVVDDNGNGPASTLNLTSGTLVLGAGGMTSAGSSVINLAGGTVSASAPWSSSRPMSLTAAGGVVTFVPAGYAISLGGNLTGVGGLSVAGSLGGSLVLGGANAYAGTTQVASGTLQVTGSHAGGGAYAVTGGTLIVGGSGSLTGAASLTVSGAGRAEVLGAVNTTPTTIGNGGLVSGSGTLSGTLTVNGDGLLTGTLTANNTVTVRSGGLLDPGAVGVGTFRAASLALESGAILRFSRTPDGVVEVTGTDGLATPSSGSATINVASVAGTGVHTLIRYAGTIQGGGYAALQLGRLPRGVTATLQHNAGSRTVELNVTAVGSAVVTWNTVSGSWDVDTTANWLYEGAPSTYLDGDLTLFDDTPGAPYTATLAADVLPGRVTFRNQTQPATLAGAFGIEGSAALYKYGAATSTVLNANSYGGGTYLTAGTLAFANNSLGLGNVTFVSNSTLQWVAGNAQDVSGKIQALGPGTNATFDVGANSVSFAGTLSGTGAVTKRGSGVLTLQSDTHTGGTAVNAGEVALAAANVGRGVWTINSGGTVRGVVTDAINGIGTTTINGGGRLVQAGGSYQQFYNGGAGGTVLVLNGGRLEATVPAHANYGNYLLRGNMTVGGTNTSVITADFRMGDNATRDINVGLTGDPSGVDLDIRGSFTHFPGVTWGFMNKLGAGTMRFASTSSGNIGKITVSGGKVLFQDVLQVMGNGGLLNNATVEWNMGAGVSQSLGVDVNGSGTFLKTGAGMLTLTGTTIDYSGSTTISAGRLRLLDVDDTWASGFAINNIAQLEVNTTARSFVVRSAAALTGDGTFIKSGTGSFTTGVASGYARWNMTAGLIDIQAGSFINDYCDQAVAWVNNKASLNVAAGATVTMVGGNIITVDALTGSGTVNNNNSWGIGTLTVGANNGSGTFSGSLANINGSALALTKVGSGTQTLTGAHTYIGATAVNGGTLRANNATGSATGTGLVTVNTGGRLGGSGRVGDAGKNVTVAAGGSLTPGATEASTGTLTVLGNLVMQESSSCIWEFGGSVSDLVHVNGNVTLPAVLNVSVARLTAGFPSPAVVLEWDGVNQGVTSVAGWTTTPGFTLTYDGPNRRVLLSAPSPGTAIMTFGSRP